MTTTQREKKQLHQDDEMMRLIAGYKKFMARYFAKDGNNPLFKKLTTHGQDPKTMVIACSDSRVDPATVMDCAPGDLFVIRNVANLVPPCDSNPKNHGTSAALEFAVRYLNVQHIILLGHSHCGGIHVLLNGTQAALPNEKSFISSWMEIAHEAKNNVLTHHSHAAPEQQAKICEEQSLLVSLKNLNTFPWIRSKVEAGELTLHAWHLDLRTGIIQQFNANTRQFEDLDCE